MARGVRVRGKGEQRTARGHAARGGRSQGKLTRRLAWELRYPAQADKDYADDVAQWLAKKNKSAPDLEEPDPIHPELLDLWNAWHELSTSRPAGPMGSPCAITWSEMSRFCEDCGVDGLRRRRWIRLLRAMDRTFLRVEMDRREARRIAAHGDA